MNRAATWFGWLVLGSVAAAAVERYAAPAPGRHLTFSSSNTVDTESEMAAVRGDGMAGAAALEPFDQFVERITADWVRADPAGATSAQYFVGAEQDGLDRELNAKDTYTFGGVGIPLRGVERAQFVARARRALSGLKRYSSRDLTSTQRITAATLRWQLQNALNLASTADYRYVFDQLRGLHVGLVNFLSQIHPIRTPRDIDSYLARLAQVAPVLDVGITEARRRAAKGIIPPKFILHASLEQIDRFLNSAVADNVLVTSLSERARAVDGLSDDQRATALASAETIVRDQILPAFHRVHALLTDQLRLATEEAGYWHLPDGTRVYELMLRSNTSTKMTPDQVYSLGVLESARIEHEMDSLLRQLGFAQGSVLARYGALADSVQPAADPDPRPTLLAEYSRILRDAEAPAGPAPPPWVASQTGLAAIFTDSLVRYRREGFKPRRAIKLALTCGEETPDIFDSVQWLTETHPEVLNAAFALNEGALGELGQDDKPAVLQIQAGEKFGEDFALEATDVGGHSARPNKNNPIVRLSAGLAKLGSHNFEVTLNPVTRAYFHAQSQLLAPSVAADIQAVLRDAHDEAAVDHLWAINANWNGMLRTTCVPTEVAGGHASNALPQRARANVNCRILPGTAVAEVQKEIINILGDDKITVTPVHPAHVQSPLPPLTPAIMGPVRKIANELWPGVAIVPTMSTGGTDGRFLNAAGIPTYGLSGLFFDAEGPHSHGLNERIRVRSLMEGRRFLYEIVKLYAGQTEPM